jgi:hypothetical protein
VAEFQALYGNLWGGFEDNCETPLRLVFYWPSLEGSVSLIQVTTIPAFLFLLGIQKVYAS